MAFIGMALFIGGTLAAPLLFGIMLVLYLINKQLIKINIYIFQEIK